VRTTLLATILFFRLPVLALPAVGVSQVSVVALLAIWGTAYGAMPFALQMWMARATPDIREGAMALFVGNFQISIALGSFVGGLSVDRLGIFDAMYAGAGLAALSILTIVFFNKQARVASATALAH
jgi:predicted MFS family arabinose efflux permease